MGFSLVAGFSILAVSMVIAFGIFTGSFLPAVTDYKQSYGDMVDRNVEQVHTDLTIATVGVSAYGLNYNHSIQVENSGSYTLEIVDCNVLINGTIRIFTCSDTYLYPEKTTYFNVSNLPGDGPMRAKVVTGNGVADYYDYII